MAQHQFTAACRMVQDALDHEDPDLVNKWTKAQKENPFLQLMEARRRA